jgi:hypothetical protein
VDLRVLAQVEQLLRRGDARPEPEIDDDDDGVVVPLERPEGAVSTTHPAAHTLEQPLVTKAPVTPLPRRR